MILTWLAATAFAADLVVHAEADGADVAARVAAAARVSADSLRPENLSVLLGARPPMLLGSGTVGRCVDSPTTLADVRGHVQQTESAILFLDYAQALAQADAARLAMTCLEEPIDGSVAGRSLFLRGVALFYAGDRPGAQEAFRQAHLFQPGLQWDVNYPEEPQALFDDALMDLAAAQTASLEVVPGPSVVPVFVDGRRITRDVTIAAGEHLVQVGSSSVVSARVVLPSGGVSALVVPGAANASAVGWAADPLRRGHLGALLTAVVGEGEVVYAHFGGRTWKTMTATDTWEELEARAPEIAAPPAVAPAPAPVPAPTAAPEPVATVVQPPRSADPRRPSATPAPTEMPTVVGPPDDPRRLWWLLPPGIGALGFGAGYGAYSYVQGTQSAKDADAATTQGEWDAAQVEYERWGDRLTIAEIVGGVGAAMTLLGVAVKVEDATFGPDIAPGRIGVRLDLRR